MRNKINGKIFTYVTSYFMIFAFIFVSGSLAQNAGNKDKGVFEKTADSAIATLQEYSKVIDNNIEDLKQRIIESPDDAALYYNLGTFYLIKYRNNNNVDQNLKLLSEENWEKALELDSEYSEKIEKVRAIYTENDKDESISSLIENIEKEKLVQSKANGDKSFQKHSETEKDVQKRNLSESLNAKKNRKLIYKFYALQDKEENIEELNALINEIKGILKDNPHDVNMYVLLKDIYVFLENTEKVIEICSEGLGNNPDSIDLLMGRGDVYLRIQQYDLARIDFENVLKINPEYKWAQERLDMIIANKDRDEKIIQELLDNLKWRSQYGLEEE